MKILILKGTVADGQVVLAGQSVDASDNDANLLIRMGMARLDDSGEPEVEATPVVTEQPSKGRPRGNK